MSDEIRCAQQLAEEGHLSEQGCPAQVGLEKVSIGETVLFEAVEKGRRRELEPPAALLALQLHVDDWLEAAGDFASARMRPNSNVRVVCDAHTILRAVLKLAKALVVQIVEALINTVRLRKHHGVTLLSRPLDRGDCVDLLHG